MEILESESIQTLIESGIEIVNPGQFILISESKDNSFEEILKHLPIKGSKGMEILELMKNPGGIDSFFECMENTEIGIGSRQVKNPSKFVLFSESGLQNTYEDIFDYYQRGFKGTENTEIGSRRTNACEDILDYYLRGSKGTENTESGSRQVNNHAECRFISGLGMENAEIGSRQTMNLDEVNLFSESCIKILETGSTKMKNCGMLGNKAYTAVDLSFTHCSDKVVLDRLRRDGLKRFADNFRHEYIYSSGIERKTCIWSGYTYSWHGKSSRIMWVGVHGMDSICVVTRHKDLDMVRVKGGFKSHGSAAVLSYFRRTAISEIEDLADPDTYSTLRQRCEKGIKKPFGVVSVIPRTDEVHEESGHEVSYDEYVEELRFLSYKLNLIKPPVGYDDKEIAEFEKIKWDLASKITDAIFQASSKVEHDEKKAIKFLQEKMRSNTAFTLNETIQTAISTFQHLFQKKFKANEINVSVIDPDYLVTLEEANHKDPYVKELEISDIEEHLAVINKPGSGGSGSRCSSGGGSAVDCYGVSSLGLLH